MVVNATIALAARSASAESPDASALKPMALRNLVALLFLSSWHDAKKACAILCCQNGISLLFTNTYGSSTANGDRPYNGNSP
jgi:hypothetical protein